MPYRLVFSPADIARVRVEPSLGPFAETVLAYSRLIRSVNRQREQPHVLSARVTARDLAMASFLWLNGNTGLDLFSMLDRSFDFAAGQEMLLNAEADTVAYEAEFWAQERRLARLRGFPVDLAVLESSPFAGLRVGALASRRALSTEIADFHRRLVQPQWVSVNSHLAAARDVLEERLIAGGVEGLLSSLGDRVRWSGRALSLHDTSVLCDSTLQLGGRGLRIVPSYLALEPQAYWPHDAAAPVLLIVPMTMTYSTGQGRREPAAGGQLLGRTRTAVLTAIGRRPHTTSELGSALNITISGASQHASLLRRAGLITTSRDGGSVIHRITSLGERLLRNLTP